MRRRELLRLGALAPGGVVVLGWAGCGGEDPVGEGPDAAGPDAAPGIDGAGTCEPTRADALGPFFEEGAPTRSRIAGDAEAGERLTLTGRIVEADCTTPIPGVLVDVWQADHSGNYHGAGDDFRLRGRVQSDTDGIFTIETVRPGHYENGPGNWRPAHVHLMFAEPGFASFPTQIYFAGDPYLQPNDGCPSCGSDDPERIVELGGDPGSGWEGSFRIVLPRA
jgi:catechol 1,2-dioxygenase